VASFTDNEIIIWYDGQHKGKTTEKRRLERSEVATSGACASQIDGLLQG